MMTPSIHLIIKKCLTISKKILFYLPRSTNVYELFEILEDIIECVGEMIYLDVHILNSANKIKAVLIIFGDNPCNVFFYLTVDSFLRDRKIFKIQI